MLLAFRQVASAHLIADHCLPDALCIPFWKFQIEPTLRQLARRAARHVGVILIGPERDLAEDFIADEPLGERMQFVPAAFDTPWLRDHAPVAVRNDRGLELYRPQRPGEERAHDQKLFETILAVESAVTPVALAGGNLVAGPDGVAVSTYDMIGENRTDDANILTPVAQAFGISRWILTPKFDDDISGHTDSMVRFLSDDT